MYLPIGLKPNHLIHHACLSPESLLRYVLEWQEANHDELCVDLAYFFSELTLGKQSGGDDAAPVAIPKFPVDSVYDSWVRFCRSAHPLQNLSVTTKDYKNHSQIVLSISWVEVLFSLDELILDKTKYPLGWLAVCMLPLVKVYSPAAYEFLIAKLYKVLALDTDLHTSALEYENKASSKVFNYRTFNLLLSKHFTHSKYLYFDFGTHSTNPYIAKLKHARLKESTLTLPQNPDTFSNLIRTQLMLCVPASRYHYDMKEALIQTGVSFDLYTGRAYAVNQDLLKVYKMNSVEYRSSVYCDNTDPFHSQRRESFYVLLEHVLKCSLKRNREFLSHIIFSLDLVIPYKSKYSIKAREALLKKFSSKRPDGSIAYWCVPGSGYLHAYKEVTSYTHSWVEKGSTLFLPDSPELLTETAMYTVDISDFLRTYATLDTARYRMNTADVLRFRLPSIMELDAAVWSYFPTNYTNAPHNPLLSPASESRNSKEYFTAYTYSLALAVGEWEGSATIACRLFNITDETNPDTASIIPLIHDSGVSALVPLWGESEHKAIVDRRWEDCVANINIPQYLIFLTQFAYLGTLYSGILTALDHLWYPSRTYIDIFQFKFQQAYYNFIKYLRHRIFTDIFPYLCLFSSKNSPKGKNLLMSFVTKDHYYEIAAPEGLNDNSDWAVSLTVPETIKWLRRHTTKTVTPNKQRLFKSTFISTIKRPVDPDKPNKRLGKREKILILDFKAPDDMSIQIKMFKRGYETFYVLPWKELYPVYHLLPPIPNVVYKRGLSKIVLSRLGTPEDRVDRGWGLYFDYIAHIKDRNPKYTWESAVLFWDQTFTKERNCLCKGVSLSKEYGYAFSLTFLKSLRDSAWVDKRSLSVVIPSLMEFLEEKSSVSIDNIKAQEVAKRRKENYEAKKKQRVSHILTTLDNRNLGLKDNERLPFTEEDDKYILHYYHVGMNKAERKELLKRVLHTWPNIQYRAKYLCNKLIKSGVKDTSLLPIMRVTKKVKQAIAAG